MDVTHIEYRAVIKFLVMEGLNATEIQERMAKVYKEQSPKYSTVAKWAVEFKRERTSLEDDSRFGGPSDVTSPVIIERVEDLVIADQQVKAKGGL